MLFRSGESSAAYERDAPRIEVLVRVQADSTWRLEQAIGVRAVREAERVGEPDGEGRQTLRLRVEWPDEVSGRFIAAAPGVEVLEPARLRDEMLAAARAAVGAYSRP